PASANLKKAFQHAHIKRFSKPPGAGKQIDLAPIFQELRYKHGLIHVIKIIGPDFLESINTNWKFLYHSQSLLTQNQTATADWTGADPPKVPGPPSGRRWCRSPWSGC